MTMEACLPFDGRVAKDWNLLGPHLRRLTAAARRFDQPHFYLIATPKRVGSIRSHAFQSLPFRSRLERALDRVSNDTETQDIRTVVKRDARSLIFLAFAALVCEDALRDRILSRIAARLRVLCSLETWN